MPARVDGWLATALHGAGDGAFAIAPDGKVILWNAAAEQLLGYTARDAIGRPCSDLLRGYDVDGNRVCDCDCRVRACIGRREPVHAFDMRTRTKAGETVWLATTVFGVPATTGDTLIVHLMRDVTATKTLLALVHERLAPAAPSANGAAAPALTARELEILHLLTQGLSTARAADRLQVSRATVRTHVQNVMTKLGVHSRLEAVAYAVRHRLF